MNLTKKSYQIITEELQRIIESGIIQPGEKLDTIENMAKQYQVGRSTIREALSHLKAQGLIESRQGGGTYIRHDAIQSLALTQVANREELIQLLQVRKIIEIGCIELAAQFRQKANLEELEQIVSKMEETIENEEISQRYDVNFHLAVARSSQNPLLLKMIENVSAMMTRTIRDYRKLWLYSEKESAAGLFIEHQSMLAAIRGQDAQAAVAIMRKHLEKVEHALYH